MVTQAIKRWLQNLFAWWPWKRSPETNNTPSIGPVNMGTAPESILRTTVDGSVSQPGATSVAVEHAEGMPPPEASHSTIEEQSEHLVVSPHPEEKHTPPPMTTAEPGKVTAQARKAGEETVSPTFEQQLQFLRYLVQRGVINEGFERGKEPGQYRNMTRRLPPDT